MWKWMQATLHMSTTSSDPMPNNDFHQDHDGVESDGEMMEHTDAQVENDDVISLHDDEVEHYTAEPTNTKQQVSLIPKISDQDSDAVDFQGVISMTNVGDTQQPPILPPTFTSTPVAEAPAITLTTGISLGWGGGQDISTAVLHRYQPSRFFPTPNRTCENLYQDLRSPAQVTKRSTAVNKKYFNFRSIKRRQLNAPHLEPCPTNWDGRPKIVCKCLPADSKVVAMGRKLLYEQAQWWPKPPRHHHSDPEKYRWVGQEIKAAQKFRHEKLKRLVEEARDEMQDEDEWERDEEAAMCRWDCIDDDRFWEQDESPELMTTEYCRISTGGDECWFCECSDVGLCDWCEENDAEKVVRYMGKDDEWSMVGKVGNEKHNLE